MRLARATGEQWLLGIALETLGNTLLGLGEELLARRRFEEGLRFQRQVGNDWVTVYNLDGLARVALAQRQYAEAQQLFAESLTLSQQVGDLTLIARSLDGFGALAAACGQPDRALCLTGAAETLRENLDAPLHPEDRLRRDCWLDPLRDELSAEAVAHAWTMGKELTLDEALVLALEQSR